MKRRFLFRYLQRLGANPLFSFKFKHFRRRKWHKDKFILIPRLSRLRFFPYEKIALRKYGFERLEKTFRLSLFFKRGVSLIYGNLRHKTLSAQARPLTQKSHKYFNLRLLLLLESRLDIVLVRSNYAVTIQQARTWIRQGLIRVNGSVVNSINYYLKYGDLFQLDCSIGPQIARWVYVWKKTRVLFLPFYNLEILPRILAGVFLGFDRRWVCQNFRLQKPKIIFLHRVLANYFFFNYEHDRLNIFFR